MNHQEKVQMLDEVQKIRALILKLGKEAAQGAGLNAGSGGGGEGLASVGKGKRVLDLF